MTVYDFSVRDINGDEFSISKYQGDVLLIVNTASKCGFTPQYKGLEKIYQKYKDRGFKVLGFPCNQFKKQEPENEEAIQEFCQINFGVTFPLFSKIDVNGPNAHPLFEYLKSEAKGMLGSKSIKWNFTKFLVNTEGIVTTRYAPVVTPEGIAKDIEKLLWK